MYVFVYNYCYFLFLGSGVEGNIGKHASATAMMRTDVQRPTPRRSCWVGLSVDCEGSEKSRPEWHFVRGSSYASQEQCSGFMCQQVRKLLWEAGLIVLVLAGRFEIQTSLAWGSGWAQKLWRALPVYRLVPVATVCVPAPAAKTQAHWCCSCDHHHRMMDWLGLLSMCRDLASSTFGSFNLPTVRNKIETTSRLVMFAPSIQCRLSSSWLVTGLFVECVVLGAVCSYVFGHGLLAFAFVFNHRRWRERRWSARAAQPSGGLAQHRAFLVDVSFWMLPARSCWPGITVHGCGHGLQCLGSSLARTTPGKLWFCWGYIMDCVLFAALFRNCGESRSKVWWRGQSLWCLAALVEIKMVSLQNIHGFDILKVKFE